MSRLVRNRPGRSEGLDNVHDRFDIESVAAPDGQIHQFWNRKDR